jgi:hypothetical protein
MLRNERARHEIVLNCHGFLQSGIYVLYVLYVTKTTQSKVVGALRAPTNQHHQKVRNKNNRRGVHKVFSEKEKLVFVGNTR